MNATPRNDAAPQHIPVPALFILMGILLLPGMDAIAKSLYGLASVSAISCLRNVTQIAVMAPGAWRESQGALWPPRLLHLHVLRGLSMIATGMTFFAGVQLMPLTDTLAITFLYPFIVAVLAPFVVGEHLTRAQLVSILLGTAGVLLIIRPGSGLFGITAVLPVLSAVAYAAYVLLTRKLAIASIPTSIMQFWAGVFGALWALPVFAAAAICDYAPLTFQVADLPTLFKILAMGLVGTAGHWMITAGARHVSANVQAGLGYAEILTSTLLGWLFWQDFPDAWSWIGIAIVIGSGLWLMTLQRKLQSSPH